MKKNIPNLDLIRAVAIVMVLIFHCISWLPEKNRYLECLAEAGQYGVDLFFALSGFLIGSLYFLERENNFKVDKKRFIIRRALRTMPPYFIVLVPSFLGSYFYEGNKFDVKYLFFLQNYIYEIPYFKISWSLCVEEHFYTLLPFVLGIVIYINRFSHYLSTILLISLFLAPCMFRVLEYVANAPFGFYKAATHLRYDPLIAGVFLSYFFVKEHVLIQGISKYRFHLCLMTLTLLLASSILSDKLFFTIGLLLLGTSFAFLVTSLSIGKQYKIGDTIFIKLLAKASYAIYLTHALTINVIMLLNRKFAINSIILGILLLFTSVFVGVLFYYSIEKPLMKFRDQFFPSRSSKQTVLITQNA